MNPIIHFDCVVFDIIAKGIGYGFMPEKIRRILSTTAER